MQVHYTHQAGFDCTCGYLPATKPHNADLTNTDLTYQIGALLIALGSVFSNSPLFNMHISQNTANLLVSIGMKLTAEKRSSRMYS
jgi:hypothetical protein